MEAPTLSIVIPVYNVSAYLEKCVLSSGYGYGYGASIICELLRWAGRESTSDNA